MEETSGDDQDIEKIAERYRSTLITMTDRGSAEAH